MRIALELGVVAVSIAVLAAWHGATGSSLSRMALNLLPIAVAMLAVSRADRRP
ncbi:hypothetical protein ACFOON_02475 [Novosphingobium piscinae]|uniref:Uncharacterized protein n=1 Tax=Novosphingobium piscinae TaxID=1507448 RepID=A0A7X1FV39_9SPHN|nr:hypothetical protein [Novosphingobium piscinae]MBC2667548.1 hypothetical protein [Novosphingobium piscinae]